MMRLNMVPGTCLAAAVFVCIAAGAGYAQGVEFSGVLDSTVTLGAGAGAGFFYGVEEYANLRMTAKLREGVAFYGALNLTALAGSPAAAAAPAFTAGENYAAALELERLSFRLNGEYLDFDGGLMRIAFGYGQVFGSSDFLNPKNPLIPDARPRAVLGGTLSAYPADSLKLRLFGAAPKNPLSPDGAGGLLGIAGDRHGDRLSLQALYAFESPREDSPRGIHRLGLSLKADLSVGLVADLLYTRNPQAAFGPAGLSADAGFDYSFLDGDFYVLAEYLYNGAASSTSARGGNPGFSGEHFLYAALRYRVNDYTGLTLACLSCLGDGSLAPILTGEHELAQGFTLSLSAQAPLDRAVFSGGSGGELGPERTGSPFRFTAKARLRF
ncbi:MAG: hypothetical protein LBU28_06790 [Spirochaetaceae bacterium]|jgi:hypothetical protein|nr:hypothetical protein [Spirochaetaceae bacterium]